MSRLARQIAEYEATLPPVVEPENGRSQAVPEQPQGPRYEAYRPWYARLLAKGCARCGGEPPGWIQRQIQTPYRLKRLLLWSVNLIPRGFSFVRVVVSRRVHLDQQAERDTTCGACPGMVKQLRVRKGFVCETRFCGECSCPKWFGARLDYKNAKAGHRCPLKRHSDSDPNAVFSEYVQRKLAEAASGQESGDAGGQS